MYSGITQGLFEVIELDQEPYLITYTVKLNEVLTKGLKVGASISVDGVCQTVMELTHHHVTFQAGKETLDKTTLNTLVKGRRVSIERSLHVGDENGGHELAGHIFETGVIADSKTLGETLTLSIQCTPKCLRYIFEKGFIGIDGSSLTVGNVDPSENSFELHLIPETLKLTNFGNKKQGELVNIEVDSRNIAMVESISRLIAPLEERVAALEAKA